MEDVAASVLSRLPDHGHGSAFVDAATGGSLSFLALRRGALSLASGLSLGLGLRRGDAVLVLSRNSLLLPQILLGVLAAGGVVVTADPDATAAEIAAAAHGSGAVMIIAEPEAEVAGVGVPLLLTSRSSLLSLSAEELIDGGDPSLISSSAEEVMSSAASRTVADLVAAVQQVAHEAGEGRRVCLASLPMCSAHGLALVALGLPAAGVTTVLPDPAAAATSSSLWEAVATHAATDVVAAPEALADGGRAMPLDASSKLTSLRRVMVAPTPLTPDARHQFRRRLPWVHLMELASPGGDAAAAVIGCNDHNSQPAEQMPATKEAASTVSPLKKIQKIILGDISSRSTTSKHPVTGNRQAISKM